MLPGADELYKWTLRALQARIMGTFAAQCMHNAMAAEDDRLEAGPNFELFTHVTRFYGKKVWRCLQHC